MKRVRKSAYTTSKTLCCHCFIWVRQYKKQSHPLEKSIISIIIIDFVFKFIALTEEDSGHICNEFRYNICLYIQITFI